MVDGTAGAHAMLDLTVRVLHAGGRYLQGREQRLWAGLVGLGVLALGGAGAAMQDPPLRWAGLAGAVAGNDLVLPGRRGNVDHVLVGPCGVVVIETKQLAGHIRCYGDEWKVNGRRRGSISQQVNSGACAVRYFLAERHPDVAPRWVEAVVVFTHPLCRLEVNRARVAVVRYSELLGLVRTFADTHRMPPPVAARLAQALAASQRAAPGAGRRRPADRPTVEAVPERPGQG